MRLKDWGHILGYIIIGYFIPRISLFFLVCGIIDFSRSSRFELANWKRYFLGNGILTWLLSPFNLFLDLISLRNRRIFQLWQLPSECQKELNQLIEIAINKPEIITEIGAMMQDRRRGMMFFKWYGKNIANSLSIPEFHRQFKYIRTIGVSVFNKHQSTSIHYGPMRVTYRVLYNLTPTEDENVYITVGNKTHFWRDDPLFIFDDTLVHRSVNESEQARYCMFIDILRPSKFMAILDVILTTVKYITISYNKIFYKNWDMLK